MCRMSTSFSIYGKWKGCLLSRPSSTGERNWITERDGTPQGHGIVGMGQLPDQLHDLQTCSPVHRNLNPMYKAVLDEREHGAHPALTCCGGVVTDGTSDIGAHDGDGNVQEQYRGLQQLLNQDIIEI